MEVLARRLAGRPPEGGDERARRAVAGAESDSRDRIAGSEPGERCPHPGVGPPLPTLDLLRTFGLDRRVIWPARRWRSSPRTAAGSTTGSDTSTARSSRASTAGRSPPACTSAWTSPASSNACSASRSTTVAGTAGRSTARSARLSTPRSTCSMGCSRTSRRPATRTCARPASAARSTCSSAICSAARAPVKWPSRRSGSSFPTRWFYDVLRTLDYFRAAGDLPDERAADAVVIRSRRSVMNAVGSVGWRIAAWCTSRVMSKSPGRSSSGSRHRCAPRT